MPTAKEKPLTRKQSLFVEEYLKDLNATQAAIRAGYSAKTAEVQGCRLLRNAQIKAAVDRAMEKRSQKTDITLERVVQELAAIGFANVSDFMRQGPNGPELIALDDLPRELSAAISEIVVTETVGGTEDNPTVTRTTKAKLIPKIPALVKLGEHLGGLVKSVRVDGEVKHTVVDGTAEDVTDEIMGIFEHAAGNSSDDSSSVH